MTTSIARTFQRCLMSGSFQKSASYGKRIDYNAANLSRLAVAQNQSASLMRSYGRSIWYMASSARNYKSTNLWPSVSCTCGSFHSESDKEFSHLLMDEIKGEKERMTGVPTPSSSWSLKCNGPDCKMTKKLQGDTIEVSFNVNGSVPPAREDAVEDEPIIAQPDFMVDIKKPSSSDTLSFECYFPDEEPGEAEGDHPNVFSIRSIVLNKGEVTDATYIIDTENIDPNVYDHLLTYLEERGINNDFADELVDIASGVENHEYIKSLEKLQNFVSCD
ncbi:unnamed protein product [Clavelina lepadiformis]|uniref:Complement component 1 Q subcomponent-binding protein, mitochondrial n=1 Tax=Clavelina lepadiformis TaxID=159417 RepID=A0ABP0FPQ4_CLALP